MRNYIAIAIAVIIIAVVFTVLKNESAQRSRVVANAPAAAGSGGPSGTAFHKASKADAKRNKKMAKNNKNKKNRNMADKKAADKKASKQIKAMAKLTTGERDALIAKIKDERAKKWQERYAKATPEQQAQMTKNKPKWEADLRKWEDKIRKRAETKPAAAAILTPEQKIAQQAARKAAREKAWQERYAKATPEQKERMMKHKEKLEAQRKQSKAVATVTP